MLCSNGAHPAPVVPAGRATGCSPGTPSNTHDGLDVHETRPDLEEAGVRIRLWECEASSNSYKDADGNTQFYLPGDPQYKDPRGFTDFPDLPGQSLNPIFDDPEAQ